jgi:hypothetical protein
MAPMGYVIPMAETVKRSLVLSRKQSVFLQKEAERLGITVSDLIRRILDEYRETRNVPGKGQTISGSGIPDGTTITKVRK